jgi:hypothetical protein
MHKYGIEKFKWNSQEGILSIHYTGLGLTPYDLLPDRITVVGKHAVVTFRLQNRRYVYAAVNEIIDSYGFATYARFYDIEIILEET